MIELTRAGVTTMAQDTRAMISSLDDALLNAAKLSQSAVETSNAGKVPVKQSQAVFRAVHETSAMVLDARDAMLKGMTQMMSIKGQSNQAETDLGCIPGMPVTISGREALGALAR